MHVSFGALAIFVAFAVDDGFFSCIFSKTFWEFKIFDKIQIKGKKPVIVAHCILIYNLVNAIIPKMMLHDLAIYLLKRTRERDTGVEKKNKPKLNHAQKNVMDIMQFYEFFQL